jgi:hypothetical protein
MMEMRIGEVVEVNQVMESFDQQYAMGLYIKALYART